MCETGAIVFIPLSSWSPYSCSQGRRPHDEYWFSLGLWSSSWAQVTGVQRFKKPLLCGLPVPLYSRQETGTQLPKELKVKFSESLSLS